MYIYNPQLVLVSLEMQYIDKACILYSCAQSLVLIRRLFHKLVNVNGYKQC